MIAVACCGSIWGLDLLLFPSSSLAEVIMPSYFIVNIVPFGTRKGQTDAKGQLYLYILYTEASKTGSFKPQTW